ncbi:hypothetical protein ACEYX6_05875 [Acinetobacter sp. c2-A9]|uniref:hypothetical protein n=1 Tax=Acinetobacter sp. c2-A9 TaxID=3342802 RepID=UPI0035B944E1
MGLIFKASEFNKLKEIVVDESFSSQIDFKLQDWYFKLLPNEELDVEISYLFQFDRIDKDCDHIEVFHNGMDSNFIQHNIINLLKSHISDLDYHLY